MDDESAKHAQWQKLFACIGGNQANSIADIDLKAGLFTAIAESGAGGASEAELAARLGYNERYVAVWGGAGAAAGLADRIEIHHGDASELDEVDAYDLITMTIVLHETGGPAEYRNVLRRCRAALTPGGTVVVSELPYPDSPAEYRTNPVYQMLAGVSSTRRRSAAARSRRTSYAR